MASTIRYQITQKEINDEGNIISESEYVFTTTYTVSAKDTFPLISGNVWQTISMGRISSTTSVKIDSNQTISIRINGGSEVISEKGMVFIGEITSLEVKNNSGNEATIEINLYGN